jgi:multicomponent Na+:H+ antiporter subunit E
VEFVRQIVIQNITLSIRVLRPGLPIRPGIVAIPTKLTGDVPLTILGSLTTLTPDTVTMDIDTQRGLIYVHWIDVKTQDTDEMYKLISASLEEKIMRWLL